jgi:hypothetical protein
MNGRVGDDAPRYITDAIVGIARAKVVSLDEWRAWKLADEIYNLEPLEDPDDWDEDESA